MIELPPEQCPFCDEQTSTVREKAPHYGLYCDNHEPPRLIRWIGKAELGLSQRSVSTRKGIKAAQRSRIMQRDSYRCQTCGRAQPEVILNVGHIISVHDGKDLGLADREINDDENLLTQCEECNLGLGKQTMPIRFVANVLMARLKRETLLTCPNCAAQYTSNSFAANADQCPSCNTPYSF